VLYLTIPLGITLLAIVGIVAIVWRKLPYLRKLTPESHEIGSTIFHDFAPEAIDYARGIPWRKTVNNVLVGIERILRRGRELVSMIDRVSISALKRVRHVQEETAKQQAVIESQAETAANEDDLEDQQADINNIEELREEEQRIIIAIAQNPKDVSLYDRLAHVYFGLSNYSDAVEALKAAVKLAPDDNRLVKRLYKAEARLKISQETIQS